MANVVAPMSGKIVNIFVEVGEKIEVDQPVVVLEAMKMESDVVTESAGTVEKVHVQEGQKVNAGDLLITLA